MRDYNYWICAEKDPATNANPLNVRCCKPGEEDEIGCQSRTFSKCSQPYWQQKHLQYEICPT